jgi:hypothetical protein
MAFQYAYRGCRTLDEACRIAERFLAEDLDDIVKSIGDVPRATLNYKQGKRCAFKGCKYKDVAFHHIDYQKGNGFYLCWFHHSYIFHYDKLGFLQLIEIMAERNFNLLRIRIHRKNDIVEISLRINLKYLNGRLKRFPIPRSK